MTLVVDAGVVAAALIDGGEVGMWAETVLLSDDLAAPHLMPGEVANVLRRAVIAGQITGDLGSLAHGDLEMLQVELFPYAAVASRVWALRENVTAYDAWYVAVAELLGAELATLDGRLARAPGVRCRVRLPETRDGGR